MAGRPVAEKLDRLLAPFDSNPWLERLEHHRVYNLARLYAESQALEVRIASCSRPTSARPSGCGCSRNRARSRSPRGLSACVAASRGEQLRALIDDG